ncbi:hypothetical protein JF55_21765 [Pseudomonas sp. 1-7]|nr:hypothetical protein JF55_21765 [Pseudomonas sp. 1-7]
MTSTTQRPEDENLGLGSNLLYGLQHVLTMYGGIVAVPLIVGQAAGLSPADISLLIAASLFVGSATISRLSILLTMVIGTLVALAFGMADFSKVSEGPVLAFPTPLHFGVPVFEVRQHRAVRHRAQPALPQHRRPARWRPLHRRQAVRRSGQ